MMLINYTAIERMPPIMIYKSLVSMLAVESFSKRKERA